MPTLNEAVADFLAQKRIAVVGVSRTKQDAANLIYRKLRDAGYQVFPVNPNAEEVEGDTCYPDLKSIPGDGMDGVVVASRPEITEQIVERCAELNIPRIWMHRSLGFMGTSVSEKAVEFCKQNNITAIPGGCPMMFCQPVDLGHKCFRWVLNLTGGLPKEV